MPYCRNCGAPIDEGDRHCPNCGAPQDGPTQDNMARNSQPQNYGTPNNAHQVVDNGGFGWGMLGFCIPLVGLILFLVWKDTKPRTSKAAGKGALISVIISVVLYVLSFVLALVSSMSY